ncbi:MAG: class I SAM-dependent methyltransferase [Bacteroidetes bacterium]|nr:MAG: class I SAM-dependent methyltransferase [Bacteroidota bacterium]MCB0803607.1 methyltransferase domain-containing protein [Flavobacteriales bacterium]
MENWFEDWFDSPYYHLLYKHRDYTEAEQFITNLFNYLNLDKKNTLVLDLACGKGRHSIHVNQLGYSVVGMDLSKQSILHAKEFENKQLHFQTADMRDFKYKFKFDLVLNLFTSFGYFKSHEENLSVLKAISSNLKPNGRIVLDYLNVKKALQQIPSEEKIKREEVDFTVKKKLIDDFIVKKISFNQGNKTYQFKEFVKSIDLNEFKTLANEANLTISETFGDYALNKFNEDSSDRLILILEKNVH